MNKKELIKTVQKKLSSRLIKRINLSQEKLDIILGTIVNIIIEENSKGNSVKIQDFGTFKPYWKKERMFKHPKTKEVFNIKGKSVPKFHSSNFFKTNLETSDKVKF
jgi:nucleoid DNA-binding protein